jgi:hypothetical protein
MSTRDDNDEDFPPSNTTGYRFPVRDRRFETAVVEEDNDDVDELDLDDDIGDDPDDLSPTPPVVSIPSVRHRVRPAASAHNAGVSPEAPEAGDEGTPDPVAPEPPGVQVSDAPTTSRVRNAANRARNVQLSDRESTILLENRGVGMPSLFGNVMRSPRVQGTQQDRRDLGEFDQQFVEEARLAFGEGFIPQSQLPGELSDRIRHIVSVANVYAKEFLLDQLERMIMSKVPLDTIAARLRVSTSTIVNWRKQLKQRWSDKVKELKSDSIGEIIGEHMAKFEVRISMGMAMAQKPNATIQEISKGLEIAERAQTNLIKYQDMLGLHEQKPLAISRDSANAEDNHVRAAKQMTNAMAELMGGFVGDFPVAGDIGDDDMDEDNHAQVG